MKEISLERRKELWLKCLLCNPKKVALARSIAEMEEKAERWDALRVLLDQAVGHESSWTPHYRAGPATMSARPEPFDEARVLLQESLEWPVTRKRDGAVWYELKEDLGSRIKAFLDTHD